MVLYSDICDWYQISAFFKIFGRLVTDKLGFLVEMNYSCALSAKVIERKAERYPV